MLKDMTYHRWVGDETDDLHFTAEVGTGQGVDLPYFLDALPPGF